MENSIVRFIAKDGRKRSPKDYDNVKKQIQKIDGTTIKIPSDLSFVDITIPEGNYYLIRYRVFDIEMDRILRYRMFQKIRFHYRFNDQFYLPSFVLGDYK